MKQLLGSPGTSYTFNPATKTISISGVTDLRMESIMLVTNLTRDTIIYVPQVANKGHVSFSNGVLVLDFDTNAAGHQSTDKLQVWYDVPVNPASNDTLDTLQMLLQLLRPLANLSSSGRTQVDVGAVTTLGSISTAVTTIVSNTVTTTTAFDGVYTAGRAAFAQAATPLLTF
jgi:hypothetical protein